MTLTLRDVQHTDAAALAQIVVTANENAFRGRVPDQCLEFSIEESTANWQRTFEQGLPEKHVMLMALDGQAVVGYGWGGPNVKHAGFQAELIQIMLLPAYQGQGIGRRLLCAVASRLIEYGLTDMTVEVLRINPNRPFYERMGAVYQSDFPYDWDGVTLPMCIYAWADLPAFLAQYCT